VVGGRALLRRPLNAAVAALVIGGVTLVSGPASAQDGLPFPIESIDGSANNMAHPTWGQAGTNYSRVAPAHYADGHSAPAGGPNSRYISNRLFSDEMRTDQGQLRHPDFFAENRSTQWGWVWGQFIDHTIGLAEGRAPGDPAGEEADIPVDNRDPMEVSGIDRPGSISFERSTPAPGTGVHNARQQVNDDSSYIDAFAVYGGSKDRLEWMREGPVDGDMSNNGARLLMPGGYLPRRDARGDAAHAPQMELGGALAADPAGAVVAGDTRANENVGITAIQTLLAREHNRIVDSLPSSLSEEAKFQIARRVVIAEQQYITYNEFLPAMGIRLPAYAGYKPNVDASLSNEFATTAYRIHSMVHGNIPVSTDATRYTQAQLDAFAAEGILSPGDDPSRVDLAISLDVALDNPGLVNQVQLGPLVQGIGSEMQYKNDEIIDHLMRDAVCPAPSSAPACVVDLGATDVERSRDHGMPTYNELRRAYGLPPKTSFTAITGESSDAFPADPKLTPGDEINDINSLDYTRFTNIFGTTIPDENGVDKIMNYTRRTTLASRLRAIYGSVSKVDAYVGMTSEAHPPGALFGELQQAMWTREFSHLRDGDRFFYGNQAAALDYIKNTYGIDYRRSLGDLIADNTDIQHGRQLPGNVFFLGGEVPPTKCTVNYTVTSQNGTGSGDFGASLKITNTGTAPLDGWTMRFRYLDGQKITSAVNAVVRQNGTDVPVQSQSANAALAPGQSADVSLNATWTGTNPRPAGFTLNTTQCSTG
jgi:Animal haem peroxidase/Cellulose binding domain